MKKSKDSNILQSSTSHPQTVVLSKFYPKPFVEPLLKEHKFLYEGGEKGYLWWFNPDSGIWIGNGEDFIRHYFRKINTNAIDDVLKRRYILDEIVEDIKDKTYNIGGLSEPKITLLPFKNGVYDLDKNKFREFRPEDGFTWKLPWNYNPKARSKYLSKLINSMLPKKEVGNIWDLMAYILWRGYPLQVFFVLLGGGRNGKTTLTIIIMRMVGIENVASVSLRDLQDNRFAGARLYHKFVNISGEIDYSDLRNTQLLKQLCGGDVIESDRKFRKPIKFTNHAKIIFSTNQVPKTRDATDAFFRRVFLIEFRKQFAIDPSIDMRIRADTEEMQHEYEGLLYRVLQRLKRLRRRGFVFTRQEDIKAVRNRYTFLSNPLAKFVEESCEITHDHEDYITKAEFLKMLNDWLQERGLNTYSAERVGKEMKELGYQDSRKTSEGDKRCLVWVGFRWKSVTAHVRGVRVSTPFTNKDKEYIETVTNTPDKPDTPDTKNRDNGDKGDSLITPYHDEEEIDVKDLF